MKRVFHRTRMWERITPQFIEGVMHHHHYKEEDRELIASVASDVMGCIRHQECMEILVYEDYADVAITLGSNIDALLERYEKEHELLKQLIVDNICGELLMTAYGKIAACINEVSGNVGIKGMHFWGSEEKYPLSGMAAVIKEFSHIGLTCSEVYYLYPSKSILMRADISKDMQSCGDINICKSCSRYGTKNCERALSNE